MLFRESQAVFQAQSRPLGNVLLLQVGQNTSGEARSCSSWWDDLSWGRRKPKAHLST